jgi:hypothetical protein
MRTSWLIHDMIRICPQSGRVIEQDSRLRSVFETEGVPLRLTSPRNAYVSFQAVFELGDAGTAPTVVFEDLTGETDRIGREEYVSYLQWYHEMEGRYIPDALVPWLQAHSAPDRSFPELVRLNAVPDQRFGALWIDLFVPKAIKPGQYKGGIAITAAGAAVWHEIALTVLPLDVPDESLITADLNSYADNLSRRIGSLRGLETRYLDGTYLHWERQFYRMAHEHRCLFHNLPYEHSGNIPEIFVPELEGRGKSIRVKDWSRYDEHYGPYLDGSAFQGTKRGPIPLPYLYLPFNFHWPADYAKFGFKGYRTEFSAIFREFHRHFTENGWLSTKFELFLNHKKRYKLFPYDGDETRFVWDEKINDLFYDLGRDVLESREGAQFVFRTDSSWSYGLHYSKYADNIHLWVVNNLIFGWYPEGLRHLKARGNTVWTYGSAPAIGRSLFDCTLFPMASVARGTDGFVYWESTLWGDQWHVTPDSGGSTALFYPGDELFGIHGPIPSIRLKVMRGTMQVADLMERWIRSNEQEPRREAVNALISSACGMEPGDWWPGKPDFIDRPPYEWSGAELSVAPAVKIPPGRPPEAFHEMAAKLWKLVD